MSGPLTESKIAGFDPVYNGTSPHYEVWYGKVDVPGDRALWFRYKRLEGTVSEASCWAVWFDGDTFTGGKDRWWLDEMHPPGPTTGNEPDTDFGPPLRFQERYAVFRVGDAHLDDGNAIGTAGPIHWDLHWRDRGRRFCFVPPALQKFGIAQSTYHSCFSDLRVDGRVVFGDSTVEFDDATGMVGHIQGSRIAGHSWAWSHCNHFDDGTDATFEGLSARALVASRGSPLMTALVLFLDDRCYEFHGPVQIFKTSSKFNRTRWTFNADNGDARIVGEAEAAGDLAVVRYIDTDGRDVWCHNTKLGNLRLQLKDRQRGIERTLISTGRAAYETVTREPPVERPII